MLYLKQCHRVNNLNDYSGQDTLKMCLKMYSRQDFYDCNRACYFEKGLILGGQCIPITHKQLVFNHVI